MSATLNISPLSRYENGKTNIRRPREIAFFSFDRSHVSLPLSEQSLKYYCPPFFGAPGERDPRYPIMLGDGFGSFQKHDDSVDEHLDALLDTILEHEKQTGKRVEAQIVTWRGIMTKILTAPYETYDGFEMNATFYQDAIYIEENHAYKHSKQKPQSRNAQHARQGQPSPDEMQFWGYKFETLSTLPQRHVDTSQEDIQKRNEIVVDNEEQYCSIVQTSIDGIDIILAGEVDAVLGEKPDDPDHGIPWIELKTTKEIETAVDSTKFGKKLVKYWAQSFLLGVPRVVVGYRSMQGELLRIEELETHRIPAIAKQIAAREGQSTWNGNTCINFAAEVLRFVKQHVSQPDVVWRLSRSPRSDVINLVVDETMNATAIVKPSFRRHREQLE